MNMNCENSDKAIDILGKFKNKLPTVAGVVLNAVKA
jgi:hypothetical protein